MRLKILLIVLCCMTSYACATRIKDNGVWVGYDADKHHCYDPSLASVLAQFLSSENAKTVVDFGCGMGDYVKFLRSQNINAIGYDGNPYTPILSRGVAKVQDLSVPFDLGVSFDWVISLEVGEHLPPQFETIFIENLINHTSNGIILSWALEDQPGYGHFNCRNNDYIKERMINYGFSNDIMSEEFLREHSSLPWFKNTIMVFRKNL